VDDSFTTREKAGTGATNKRAAVLDKPLVGPGAVIAWVAVAVLAVLCILAVSV
jgi:hypothetical protein